MRADIRSRLVRCFGSFYWRVVVVLELWDRRMCLCFYLGWVAFVVGRVGACGAITESPGTSRSFVTGFVYFCIGF